MGKGTFFYVGGFELPDKNAAAHRVLSNAKILRNLGYDVVLVGVDTSRSAGEGLLRQDYQGFECWSVPYPEGGKAWMRYILGLSCIISLTLTPRENPGIGVICYNYPAVAQLRIQAKVRPFGMKVMSDATEWYDSSGGTIMYRLAKFFDTWLRMHVVHRQAIGVVTTSKYLTDKYCASGKPVVELPTLFDVDGFSGPGSREQTAVKNLRFIYVGSPFDPARVNKQRSNLKERLDLCVLLFHQLYVEGYSFFFEVIGISEKDYLSVFPEHAVLLKDMEDNMAFRGRVPNNDVVEKLTESDFSIFFRDETRVTLSGFPSKLAESISCGTPVITNRMLSLENYASLDVLFLAEPGNEMAALKEVFKLKSTDIDHLKRAAYRSRRFDYREYEQPVRLFLDRLGV